MWEGVTGKRRKNGIYGLAVGTVVSSILLYLSFYISFLYLLIPVILLVVFHYTKAWRFSDRAFYGLIAILIAFFLAMAGISDSISSAPHQATASLTISSVTYDIHYSYTNTQGGYVFNFTLPSLNFTNNIALKLVDLFDPTNTLLSKNATLSLYGSNYTYAWSTGQLSQHAYVVNVTLFLKNDTSKPHYVEFLGPILISTANLVILLSESLILSYLAVTYLFFLAFAFFARAISMSRKRKEKDGDQNPPPPEVQPPKESGSPRRGWFGRRNS